MLSALVLIAGLSLTPHRTVADTVIVVSAPEQGIVRMTYGAPRMRAVPGHVVRREAVAPGTAAATARGLDASPSDQVMLDRIERLINRRFDRLEALAGVDGGRGLGAVIRFEDTARGPALLLQPEGRPGAPPDTILIAEDLSPDQLAVLAPPRARRTPIDPLPRADIRQPGDPIMLDRRTVEESLFPAVRLNFEFDGDDLLGYADPTLDAIGEVMLRHPWLRLEVAGHTDNVGSAAYNLALSERRAEAARSYLLSRFDLEPERLVASGYGLTRPLTQNRTETERAVNRRVEFHALEPDDHIGPEAEVEFGASEDELRDALRDAVRDAMRESLEAPVRSEGDIEW